MTEKIKNTVFSIDNDDLFCENESLYFKNGELWGIKNNVTGELKLFHCERSNTHVYGMGTKTYNRIYEIWLRNTDERVNYLMDYIGHDSENEYYYMWFNVLTDLLK